jgi:hypothetical protein
MMLTGDDIAKTATILGTSKQTIRNYMKILDLSNPVKKAIEAGKISITAGLELYALDKSQQKTILADVLSSAENKKWRRDGKPTAREISKKTKKSKPKIRSRKEIETRLGEINNRQPFTAQDRIEHDILLWVLRVEDD